MNLAAQLTRFASVGFFATGLHVLVATACANLFGLPALLSNAVGFAAAVTLSYLGHGRFSFETNLHHRVHGPRFLLTALTGLAVSSCLTQITVVWLGAPFVAGMAVVALAVPASTYVLCRFWVFRPTA